MRGFESTRAIIPQKYNEQSYQEQKYQGKSTRGKSTRGKSTRGKKYQGQKYQGREYQGQKYQGRKKEGQKYQGQDHQGKEPKGERWWASGWDVRAFLQSHREFPGPSVCGKWSDDYAALHRGHQSRQTQTSTVSEVESE